MSPQNLAGKVGTRLRAMLLAFGLVIASLGGLSTSAMAESGNNPDGTADNSTGNNTDYNENDTWWDDAGVYLWLDDWDLVSGDSVLINLEIWGENNSSLVLDWNLKSELADGSSDLLSSGSLSLLMNDTYLMESLEFDNLSDGYYWLEVDLLSDNGSYLDYDYLSFCLGNCSHDYYYAGLTAWTDNNTLNVETWDVQDPLNTTLSLTLNDENGTLVEVLNTTLQADSENFTLSLSLADGVYKLEGHMLENGEYIAYLYYDVCVGECYWDDYDYDDYYAGLDVWVENNTLMVETWDVLDPQNTTLLLELMDDNGTQLEVNTTLQLESEVLEFTLGLPDGWYWLEAKLVTDNDYLSYISYDLCLGNCSWYDDDWDDDWNDDWNDTEDDLDMDDLTNGDELIDMYFEQVSDSEGEMLMRHSVLLDSYLRTMVDLYLGNADGEVDENEAELFLEEMLLHMEDEPDWDGPEFLLDGESLEDPLDTWIDLDGLVGTAPATMMQSYDISLTVNFLWVFDMQPYDETETLTLEVLDDEDYYDEYENASEYDGYDDYEDDCDDEMSLWVHNGATWSIENASETNDAMIFTYDDLNDAWFSTIGCDQEIDVVTFELVKTEGGELPEEDLPWDDMELNLVPYCTVAYYVLSTTGEFEFGMFVDKAPESGSYEIELDDGMMYALAFACEDPEGEMLTLETTYNGTTNINESQGITYGWLAFAIPAGVGGELSFDFAWSDGVNSAQGDVLVKALGDGSTGDLEDGNLTTVGGAILPGFTSMLAVSAGAAAFLAVAMRREDEE